MAGENATKQELPFTKPGKVSLVIPCREVVVINPLLCFMTRVKDQNHRIRGRSKKDGVSAPLSPLANSLRIDRWS